MPMDAKKTLLFGGSYNPIHQGHLNAAINAFNYLKCDEVWLIPRKYNYDGSLLLDGKHRIAMMKLALSGLDNFKICDIELKDQSKKYIYTYNTAKYLTRKYKKDYKFYFLIGADQLNNIENWYEIDKLTKLFQFVCFRRPGYPIVTSLAKKYNITIIEGNQIDASSTMVRAGYFDKVNDDIQNYIMEHELYLKERIMPHLTDRLFIHSLTSARLAKSIASSLNVNSNRAYVASILHDISKSLPIDEIKKIIEVHYPSKLKLPEFAWHQYASAYLASVEFGIKDKKTLKAISSHCYATFNMSSLDKIVYCADKLEESRSFASEVVDIRKEAFEDINLAFIHTMEEQLRILKIKKAPVDKHLEKLLKYYKERI